MMTFSPSAPRRYSRSVVTNSFLMPGSSSRNSSSRGRRWLQPLYRNDSDPPDSSRSIIQQPFRVFVVHEREERAVDVRRRDCPAPLWGYLLFGIVVEPLVGRLEESKVEFVDLSCWGICVRTEQNSSRKFANQSRKSTRLPAELGKPTGDIHVVIRCRSKKPLDHVEILGSAADVCADDLGLRRR